MDEPTNHLDLYTAKALDGLLRSWSGTLLLVTHDRRLTETEHVAERLLFIEGETVRLFEGTWGEFAASRAKDRAGVRDALTEMRMAELSARIANERDAEKKEMLKKEWANLMREVPRKPQQIV